jgi:hypothetical protein
MTSDIVVNSLTIAVAPSGGWYLTFDIPDLDPYFKDCVIGGPGAFVMEMKKKA